MIIDHCSSAVLNETIENSVEDRSVCDFRGVVPGDGFILAPMPVQLGGRISPRASYPSGLTATGFVGSIKDLIHNGEVRSALMPMTHAPETDTINRLRFFLAPVSDMFVVIVLTVVAIFTSL